MALSISGIQSSDGSIHITGGGDTVDLKVITGSGGVQLGQDLGGTNSAPVVIGIQTIPVSASTPINGEALILVSGVWTPTAIPLGISPGTGIGVAASAGIYTISNTGVLSFNTRTGAVTLTAADVESTFNAKGDIFLGTGSGTGTILPVGTTGQVPTVTAGGTLAYATPASAGVSSVSAGAGGSLTISPTTGAVVASRAALTGDVTASADSNTTAIKSSVNLSGNPTTTTQTALTDNTTIATTAYTDTAVAVETSRAEAAEALLAPLASPALTGVPTAPTAAAGDNTTQVATDAFVQTAIANAIAGVNPAIAANAATVAAADTSGYTFAGAGIGATATGPTNNVAALIDGFTFTAVGQRLLIKNDTQSPSGAHNGIYTLTALQTSITKPIFTRSLDYDTPSDINSTGAIPVISGTANADTSWIQTATIVTVDTTPMVFQQFQYSQFQNVQRYIQTSAQKNYIESGCVWTADAAGSTLNASMTSGVVFIAGVRLTVAAVTAHGFTASKDTYVDFQNNGDGTANITYTAVANNAASPALGNSGTTANTIRNAILVTGASFFATGNNANPISPTSNVINQGDPWCVLPVASSQNYSVTDSLGNLIYPTSPSGQMVGFQQRVTSFTTTTTSGVLVDVTGLQVTFIVPPGPYRRVRVQTFGCSLSCSLNGIQAVEVALRNGSTQLAEMLGTTVNNTTGFVSIVCGFVSAFAPGTYTIKTSIAQSTSSPSTLTLTASATQPAFISAELV